MNDDDLRKEFIRVHEKDAGVQISVCTIGWEGPHTPVSKWVVGREFHGDVNAVDLGEATTLLLEDTQYFRICQECGERNPVGWMHDKRICHGCAQRNHRIVY